MNVSKEEFIARLQELVQAKLAVERRSKQLSQKQQDDAYIAYMADKRRRRRRKRYYK